MNFLSVRIEPKAVSADGTANSKQAIFATLASMAQDTYGLDASLIANGFNQREKLGSTGFGGGSAIPHAKIEDLNNCVGLFLRLAEPVPFDAHDGQPVDLVFGLLSPAQGGPDHLKALAEVSRYLRDETVVAKLRGASGADALYALLTGNREQQAA